MRRPAPARGVARWRPRTSAAAAFLVLTGSLAAAAPAGAADCPSGQFCAWEHDNFQGQRANWHGDDGWWESYIADADSSWANHGTVRDQQPVRAIQSRSASSPASQSPAQAGTASRGSAAARRLPRSPPRFPRARARPGDRAGLPGARRSPAVLPSLYNLLPRCPVSPLDPRPSPPGLAGGRTDEGERFMRRTVLAAAALACAAVLATAVPAFADGAPQAPSAAPSTGPERAPTEAPSPVPSAPAERTAPRDESPAPREDTRTPREVTVVPEGAPDTGVAPVSSSSGSSDGLVGGGAAAAFAVGGAAVVLVRRRRASGA
ncbi:hypothetical protein GCM10027168_10780 [Streptomyces capparidis]